MKKTAGILKSTNAIYNLKNYNRYVLYSMYTKLIQKMIIYFTLT